MRNRIIAGLAEVVVVVEATLKGGARITAERALEYGRTVMAYPGSRRNPSAAGTNALLYDGAGVVLEPSDVLVALELEHGAPRLDLRAPPVGRGGRGAREPATANRPRSTSWRAALDSRRRPWSRRCGRSSATAGWSGHAACAGRDDGDAPTRR